MEDNYITFLRRAAQLVQDLRTLDVLLDDDKVYLTSISGTYHISFCSSDNHNLANDAKTIIQTINEEFSDEVEVKTASNENSECIDYIYVVKKR